MLSEKANDLGRLIGQSAEYQAVKRANDALQEDRELLGALQRMEQLRTEAQRMLQQGQKLKMAVDLQVQFHPDDLMAYNTLAEIPGTDLQDQIVMLGAHLDSWHSGTGATDNGAGVAAAMEAVRILEALKLHPRRTIRILSWISSRGMRAEWHPWRRPIRHWDFEFHHRINDSRPFGMVPVFCFEKESFREGDWGRRVINTINKAGYGFSGVAGVGKNEVLSVSQRCPVGSFSGPVGSDWGRWGPDRSQVDR